MACMKRLVFMAVSLFAFVAQGFSGDKLINIQGRLTDSLSNPLSGNRAVTFRLYNSTADPVAARVWEDSLSVKFSSGIFHVTLGQGANSLDSTPFNKPYYLGIQVSGDANEMKPRQLLGASAYALGSLGDFNVKGKLGVGTSTPTTTLEVMSDAVPQLLIRKKTATTNGLYINSQGEMDLYPGNSSSMFKFSMAGSEKMRITSDGKIGIGTTAPQHKLQLVDSVNGTMRAQIQNINVSTGQSRLTHLEVQGNNGVNQVVLRAGRDASNNPYEMIHGETMLQLGVGAVERLRVKNGNEPGAEGTTVKISSPWTGSHAYYNFIAGLDGNGVTQFAVRGNGDYYQVSSRSLKSDIQGLSGSLNTVSRLNGVSYKFNKDINGKRKIGFVAEDLREIVPEAVDEERMMVNYSAVIPLLVESVKELKANVEALERRMAKELP